MEDEGTRALRGLVGTIPDGVTDDEPAQPEAEDLEGQLLALFRAQLPYSALHAEEVKASPLFAALVQLIESRAREARREMAERAYEAAIEDYGYVSYGGPMWKIGRERAR